MDAAINLQNNVEEKLSNKEKMCDGKEKLLL